MLWRCLALWLTAFALWAAPAGAELAIPKLTQHVTDQAQLLSPEGARQLEQTLTDYERTTGHQFALLTLPSLEGAPMEDYSIRVAEAWRLGDEKRDDGLLLIVAKADRKTRIEVGYGLEGAVPDALAARIIRHQLTPQFRQGNFEAGLQQGFATLMKAAQGESVRVGPAEPERKSGVARLTSLLPVLLWVGLLALGVFGGLGRRRGRGGFIIGGFGGGFGGGGFSGGGRGGGGGGGFSGGGGGFGGGGASGGW